MEPKQARKWVHILTEQGKTPEQISVMLRWQLSDVEAELKNSPPTQKQETNTASRR